MPIDYRQYPADWQAIRARILQCAGDCCEECGAVNHAVGVRLADGTFLATPHHAPGDWVGDRKVIRIVLTIAHVNHDIGDNRDDNLRAWCQRCHNRHDAAYRAQNRKARTHRSPHG